MKKLYEMRCLLLFWALIVLLVSLPFLNQTHYGRIALAIINVTVLMTAIAAVVRTWSAFVVAVILVMPALAFRILTLESGLSEYFAMTCGFNAVFYAYVLAHLLQYVFRLDLITKDKLYGAVAAYILIAIFWAQLHGLAQYFYPGAYTLAGAPQSLDMADLIYFSFVSLATTGFGDIAPAVIQSRYLTVLEMITGVMFVAILIARLTGVYPILDRKS